ncbi:PAS domain-containing protein [Halorussus sp. AFM4]|uniref:PAS domain-containing protein n=1 Tax=Halorussus sp. AFM4 TaxID=3421651 RepID=UPI003EBAC088
MDPSSEANGEPQTRIRQQEVVAELGQQALETESLDQLLRDAADAVARTLGTDYAAVFEFSHGTDGAVLRAGAGWPEGLVGAATVPADADSHLGRVRRRREPVVVDDLRADEPFSGSELFAGRGVTGAVGAPVGSGDDTWGVLGVYATDRREFTEYDATFVRSVANVLASAAENERTRSQLEEIYGRISDAFFALDEDWRFTYLNERAHELINPGGRELVGRNVWEAFPEAVGREFKPKYERAMYEQETVAFEEYYPEPLDAWFEVRAYPSESGLSVYFRDVTERHEREQELQLFRTLLDHSTDSVLVIDPETGRYLDANDTACRRRGYSREEFLTLSVPDVETEIDDREEWRSFVEELRTAGGRITFDGRHRRRDGTTYPVEVNASYVELDREYVLAVSRDVTERHEREQELREKERRFEAVFEDPNILVGLLDPDGTVLDINQTAMEYIDADLEAVTGELFWETPWWGEGEEIRSDVREWTERAAAGEYVNFEADLTRPDGERYTLNGVFRPVTDDDGEVVSVLVSDRDITERRAYERRLERSEQRYRTLAESFPNGVVTLFDGDLRYTLAAGRAFEDLPVSRADIEGRTPDEAWGEEVGDALEPSMRAALDGEETAVELSYVGRDWLVYVVPITDEDGDVFGGMTMAQDITERKEYQQRLERTVEKLEESNERLESFASMLAHELRNPVQIGQIYGRQLPEEAAPEAVDYVTEAFDRIEDMIDVMLVLTRGRDALDEQTEVDLAAVAREAWDELDTRDATLTVAIDDRIQADETYARHLFRNLFENAVEHGSTSPRSQARENAVEHGGGDVTVTVGELPTGFYVEDDGVGIPPDERDAVLEAGYTTTAGQGGTGLGLAFVKELADVYEWDVAVTESDAGGARFEFTDVPRTE